MVSRFMQNLRLPAEEALQGAADRETQEAGFSFIQNGYPLQLWTTFPVFRGRAS
jgi:hypothetical protein